MNDQRNLIAICQSCHDAIHAGSIEVGDLISTSDGPERQINHVETKTMKKGKWSEEELKTVKETLQRYSSLSLKAIRAHLSSKHAIDMSETVLARIKRE
jgi:hypothetical protein